MAKKKSKPQTKSPKSKEAEVPAAKVSAPAPEITPAKDGSGKYLMLIFIIAFAAHLVLNIHIKAAPTVVIDEGLYTNIARSLAFEGEIAFRGQPVNYPYLLYPMLLVPVYLLNNALGGDVFHYIQVLGTLLATSSLIPAYLFAKRFTGSGKKALLSAAAVALMPDMLMGAYAMSESLLWMLSLWLIYFAYRLFTEHKAIYGLLTALFSGLMFAAKPGAVVMGAVLLLAYLIYTIREKKGVLKAVLPILLLVAIAGTVYGIFLMLYHYPDTILGLYEKQTSEWKSKDFLVALDAFFLLSFLFVFASGGFFSIFPYTHLKEYSKEKRRFMIAAAVGVAAIIAGTAIFVVPYKWDGSLGKLPLHMRYCAMYLPMMLTFTTDLDSFPKKNKGYTAALIAFIILCFFPGARAGFVAGKTGIVDSFALASFVKVNTLNGNLTGWLVTAFVVLASLVFLFIPMEQKGISGKEKQKMFNLAKVFFILFLAANSVCAHIGANVYIDPTIAKDAMEVKETVGDKEALGICQRYYDDIYSYWLDGRLVYPMQQVTSDQIFVQMEETGGVYSPFVPVEQAPNMHNHETPDTDTLVLGMTIAEHMEWNKNVSARTTENGHFTILTIDPSKRWVDTMMYGLDDDTLYPDVGGYIHIYDQNRNIGGSVYLTITASGSGKLKIGSKTISLESQEKSYEVTVPFSEYISLTAEDKAANIKSYSTRTK